MAAEVVVYCFFKGCGCACLQKLLNCASGHFLSFGVFKNGGLAVADVVAFGAEFFEVGFGFRFFAMFEKAAIAFACDAGVNEVEIAALGAVGTVCFECLNFDFAPVPHGARMTRKERETSSFWATDGQQVRKTMPHQ